MSGSPISRRALFPLLSVSPFVTQLAAGSNDEIFLSAGDAIDLALGRLSSGTTRRIRLKTGNYGPLTIQGLQGSRLEIVGEKGAVVGPTIVRGCNNIIFRNVEFRGERAGKTASALVLIDQSCKDILFERCSFSTSEDSTTWTGQDWVDRPFPLGLFARGQRITVKESHFVNLRNCLNISGDGGIVEKCIFESFGNDAIEFGANDLRIVSNVIRGGYHTSTDPLHADAIQGFPAPKNGMFRNILIESNNVEFNGPGDYMQGITIFDGQWQNVSILKNKVSINHWHAITLYGIDGLNVEGNIVTQRDRNVKSWIEVRASKSGKDSTNVVVLNNTAPNFRIHKASTFENNKIIGF